jgi:hypothetical protein
MPLTDYFTADDDQAALAALTTKPENVIEMKGLDPVVVLGTLEALLTGVPYDEVTADPRQGHLVSDPEESPEAFIVAVTDRLQEALATADDAHLTEVAQRWALTEELIGADPDDLANALRELSALAGKGKLYCRWAL